MDSLTRPAKDMGEKCLDNCVLSNRPLVPCVYSCFERVVDLSGVALSANCSQCLDDFVSCSQEKCHECRFSAKEIGMSFDGPMSHMVHEAFEPMMPCIMCVMTKCSKNGFLCNESTRLEHVIQRGAIRV